MVVLLLDGTVQVRRCGDDVGILYGKNQSLERDFGPFRSAF
jgi:hypothetical protein